VKKIHTSWPLCGYHFSTRRQRRIPKTISEDAFREEDAHPERRATPRRRIPKTYSLKTISSPKTNCTSKTISEDAFREEDVRPERRIAPRRRTPKAHFAKTNSTPKTIYTLKTNSEDAFREDGFHPIHPEDEFRRRIPQRRIPPRRRIKVHPEARNYMELLKFFTAPALFQMLVWKRLH